MGNWDKEKAPSRKVLLPEGWRNFQIEACEKTTSKSGNMMFKVGLLDEVTQTSTNIYLIAVQGKRWALKQVLEATGVEKQEEDEYDYSTDLLGKKLSGLVIHEPNDYINRNGEEVKAFQHKVAEFKECGFAPIVKSLSQQPSEIECAPAWEE